MEEVVENIEVDSRIHSYQNVFTEACAREIMERSSAPKLRPLIDNLGLNWRAASYVACIPREFVFAHKSSWEILTERVGDGRLLQLAGELMVALKNAVPELVPEPTLCRKIHDALVKMGANLRHACDTIHIEYPIDQTWGDMLNEKVFALSVWSSERLSFQSVYNTYEHFILDCVRLASNEPKLRTTHKEFKQFFKEHLGEQTYKDCWTDLKVNRLRLIRHALAHASGEVTGDMQSAGVKARTLEGKIQIWPEDVRDAIGVLAPRVIKIIDAAAVIPKFN